MTDWWQRLEERGRVGGWIGVLASVALIGVAVALWVYPMTAGWGRWMAVGPRFVAAMVLAVGLPGLFGSLRLLLAPIYPSASSVFPSLSEEELVEAIRNRHEDICVCTRCRVIVPADFSTGSCPVCASAVDYQDVCSDEDADLAIAAL